VSGATEEEGAEGATEKGAEMAAANPSKVKIRKAGKEAKGKEGGTRAKTSQGMLQTAPALRLAAKRAAGRRRPQRGPAARRLLLLTNGVGVERAVLGRREQRGPRPRARGQAGSMGPRKATGQGRKRRRQGWRGREGEVRGRGAR